MNTLEVGPAYLQVFSLGLLWVFFHCTPMCGPIVAGLNLKQSTDGKLWKALLLYQSGRGLVYLVLGALAGAMGAEFLSSTPELGWLITAFLLMMLLQKLFGSKQNFLPISWLTKFGAVTYQLQGAKRVFFMGVLLGFLPCMLMFWALAIAAGTKSALHGALTMFSLILMTSIPIGVSISGGSLIARLKALPIEAFLLAVSTLWSGLMTAAACDLISHQMWHISIFGKMYGVMLW